MPFNRSIDQRLNNFLTFLVNLTDDFTLQFQNDPGRVDFFLSFRRGWQFTCHISHFRPFVHPVRPFPDSLPRV